MRFRKKGAEESLSTLIGIIVALMIIIPVIIIGYRYWAEGQDLEECYNQINKAAKGLANGDSKSFMCRFNKDYAIISLNIGERQLATGKSISHAFKGKEEFYYLISPKQGTNNNYASICFGKSKDYHLKSENKLSTSFKCTEIKGIKKISGIWLSQNEGPFNTKSNIQIKNKNIILGIVVKKEGENLIVCTPGELGTCSYAIDKAKLEIMEDIKNCQNYSGQKCICGKSQIHIEQGMDFIMKQEEEKITFNYYEPVTQIWEEIGQLKGDLCIYSNENKEAINAYSFNGIYAPGYHKGYNLNNKEVKLIKIEDDVCLLKFDEWDASIPQCSEMKIIEETKKTVALR
ncbi:MAG: hypothetical protein U9Q69_06345 [Nanoarchaeota archaeon]|nr:hypothetical protein [Nanoarchaeota archaeon]